MQIDSTNLVELMTASREFLMKLKESPMWPILKNEPVIVRWIAAVESIDRKEVTN